MAGKSDKIIVYQIMTRLFGNKVNANKRYGNIEENGVGKMADINAKALKELKKFGATHIWYTGVLEHASMSDYTSIGIALDDVDVVKGRAGSPYAIKDYYDISPDLAVNPKNRKKEFLALVDRTHKEGLKVLIDFVPNHVARGYSSDAAPEGVKEFGADDDVSVAFKASNNFYYVPGQPFQIPAGYDPLPGHEHPTKDQFYMESPAKATGNDVFSPTPSINDWFETTKLNYGVDYVNFRERHFDPIPDTWNKMLEILTYWTEQGVDGFRCDMAEMVPVEFWEWVIPKVQAINPDIIFIAEIYNPNEYRNYIEKGHFDYLYDKVELYDTLRHIIEGKANTDHITTVWQRQEGIAQHMLRFLENHDEQRIASPFFAGNAKYAIPAMVLTATMHTGPVMVYFGQEVGEPATGSEGFSGEDGRTTIFDYWGVPKHQAWMNGGKFDSGNLSAEEKELRELYQFILSFSSKEPIIASGGFYDLHYFNRSAEFTGHSNNIFTFLRHNDKSAFLIAVSFNKEENEQVRLKIPADALTAFNMHQKKSITFTSYLDKGEMISMASDDLVSKDSPNALSFEIAPNSFKIYRLTGKN
ncbi:alpha-amylase family protein [Imperialibacter sp. 75]|uniref:alpha-amylase family protein n=2 Tax=Imperialibacter TaxID=1649461 RepID=UPI00125C47F2|nr:alpha-amylase family protein [Imperialibacter sp. 75]CAD5256964.1 Glycosidase [Imperialibacter sp. 89]CAD5271981.1 Glycosidase [Imperialibacter sp. 75]VVT18902.1 Alpha-amylase [Imperialibacter sp. EC-SDR9]